MGLRISKDETFVEVALSETENLCAMRRKDRFG